jgi:hypothetical protein
MTRWIVCGVVVLGCLRVQAASTPTYRVTVTRKDHDLYRIDLTKLYVKTKYCYEYVYSEEALLTYERGGLENKLIFDKRPLTASCDVDKVLSED